MKILGLGTKFVPTPPEATTKKKAMESCEETERSVGWKVYFSGEEDNQDFIKSKMYMKSTNQPPIPPPQISLRMSNFEIQLRKLFSHHP